MIAAIINSVLLFNLILMAFSPIVVEDAAHTSPPKPSPQPAQLTIAETVFSTTGVFSVPLPEGDWFDFVNDYDHRRRQANIILVSPDRSSIAQAFMFFEHSADDVEDLNENYYNDAFFRLEWSTEYERTDIVRRKFEGDYLRIDFDLIAEGEKYAGRQISWLEEGHVFNIRLVVPLLHIKLLGELQTLFLEKFIYYPHMLNTPLQDTVIASLEAGDVIVKLPDDWEPIGSLEETLVVYTDDYERFLVMAYLDQDVDLSDLGTATEWFVSLVEPITLFDSQSVEQRFGTGYWFSYSFLNEEDVMISSALAVFPSHSGGASLVQVSVISPDTNLLEGRENLFARQILESVTLLAPDDFVNIER